MENKRDLSISMARANVVVLSLSIPISIAQYAIFLLSAVSIEISLNPIVLLIAIILGIVVHEVIHGLSWVIFGRKPLSMVKFGFQWKTVTPYAHLKEPIEVNVYRLGTFLPGFLLGILPYILSLLLNDANLFWYSIVHTAAAGGDWLVLWMLRDVRGGMLVEDHPTNAGCYVIEPQTESAQ
jgi:hypothetical protein